MHKLAIITFLLIISIFNFSDSDATQFGIPPKTPNLAASEGNVYLIWKDNVSEKYETLVTTSTDNGFSFTRPIVLGKSSDSISQIRALGENVYVVGVETTPNSSDVFFARSTDSGITFDHVISLSGKIGRSHSPQLVISGGNVYVTWVMNLFGNDEVVVRTSKDNGTTFGATIDVSKSRGISDHPRMAVSGSNVYVVWQESGKGNFDIGFSVSTNSGDSFRIMSLSDKEVDSFFPTIAAYANNVYITWEDRLGENFDVSFRASRDNGVTFDPAIRLDTDELLSDIPEVVAFGDNVYVMWRAGSINGTEVLFRKSNDNGITFDEIKRLSETYGPSQIAIYENNVYLVWENRVSNNNEIFWATSTDGGNTFRITKVSETTGDSVSAQIAIDGENVYVVWTDYTFSRKYGEVFFARSTNEGLHFENPIIISNTITSPNDSGQTNMEQFTISSVLDRKNYTIAGKSFDVAASSFEIYPNWGIEIRLMTRNGGVLELTLPRDIIDEIRVVNASIEDYTVALGFQEVSADPSSRTIRFIVPADTYDVEIKGAKVVPEFPISLIILATCFAVLITLRKSIIIRWPN